MTGPLKILVVHGEVPMPDRNSLSVRLHNLLSLMVLEGHAVTLLARSAPPDQERYALELERLGIEVIRGDPVRAAEAGWPATGPELDIASLLREGGWDVAWLSEVRCTEQYAPYVRALAPCARIVSDTGDVAWVREHRGAMLSGSPVALAAAERTRERELAAYRSADALIAVSDADGDALRELAPDVPVFVISNIHQPEPAGLPFSERCGLVFVGNFGHVPNVDAMLHFHAAVWPRVRERLQGAPLTIVGAWPPAQIAALAGEGVAVTGWVETVRPYLDAARVAIAPLRFGAGVKGKVGEALATGLPVVGTPLAFEGMELRDVEHVLHAEPGEQFADAIVRLHTNERLWSRLSTAGRAQVQATLGPEAARRGLTDVLERLAGQLWIGDEEAIDGYLRTYVQADPVSLVLPVPAARSEQEQALARIASRIRELGHDPDDVPDIVLVPTNGELPAPSRARRAPGPSELWQEALRR
jgi:O-antigen biosynthesis protein